MKLYVGNLSFETQEDNLREAFATYGELVSATVIMDHVTGRSRGFGFVEMPNATEAAAAIQGLDGTMLSGRTLTVNEAKDRGATPGGAARSGGGGRSRY